MTDRYRSYPAGRSAAFNPARVSLPAGLSGYGLLYGAEPDFVASPTRYTTAAAAPRGYATTAAASGVPPAVRPYTTVSQEPRTSRPSTRESIREPSRSRRSTVDSTARPPIIITTMQDNRPHAPSAHATDAHGDSPVRDAYRSSDGKLYSQPASSIRSRSTARPYHASSASEDYGSQQNRGEVVLAGRDADVYRSARPHVVYPSDPRHSNAAIDYGDDGYQYTNAGELVRYDLDHGGPSRSRRHESFDRAYSRPNVNYNADQRSFNVNTTHDLGRIGRPYDSRKGPPPSTRGFDKINRVYDNVRDIPPAAPVPPVPTPASQLEAAGAASDRREGRRTRPASLSQEPGSRPNQPEDYYRAYEADGPYDSPRYHDDSVTARGFGIRTSPTGEPEDRHSRYWDESKRDELGRGEPRRDESSRMDELRREKPRRDGQKLSDEELARESDLEREEWYRGYKDDPRDRREGRRDDDQEEGDRFRVRDKLAAGLGMAAAAVGLSPTSKRDEKAEVDDKESRRRQSPDDGRGHRRETNGRERPDLKPDVDVREHSRRDAEPKLNGEVVVLASDSDDAKRTSRRHRLSNAFDPNDTSDLRQIKEQFAAMKNSDRGEVELDERVHTTSPIKDDRHPESPSGEETRSRDLVVRGSEEKQVRVVSPPREKKEEKPLKGILKQPKASFPEEHNPIREGVAPHKEDKKLKEAPPGARWTKINRKVVNPEALEIGKERFEVRDDFVIVLRVLSKEEIQAYAAATQVLRERRRNKETGDRDHDTDRDRDNDRDYDRDHDRDYEEEERGRRTSHRHRRHREEADDEVDDRDQDRDRERRRRHRRDNGDEYGSRSRDLDHHHRSHREP